MRCRDRWRGRGQDHAEAAAASRQRDGAFEEELITVCVAIGLRRVDAGVSG